MAISGKDTELTLRPYAEPDWEAIASIHDRARLDELRSSVGVEAFLSLAETAEGEGLFEGEVWVAVTAGGEQVVGFVAFAADELTWLYVEPLWYRRGVGRSLLRLAIDRCGPVLETSVLCGNDAALKLYVDEGFEIVETKQGVLNGNERFPATGHILRRDRARFQT